MRCGYWRQIWECGDTREVEEKHTGRYGAAGQKRIKRKRPTPEDMARQNQWKRVRDLRRLIKWNFREKKDYWVTLTYRKGDRPSWEQMKKDLAELIGKLRKAYRAAGEELKYIYRLGIGKKGGPHVHIILNRISGAETGTDMMLAEFWSKGHANIRSMYEEGGYADLAEYIAKPLEEWEPEGIKRYTPSRNLVRKEPEPPELILRRSLADRHGNMKEPKPPKGYYVDRSSIRMGRNPVTGYFYRHYTLVKLDRRN